MALGDLAKWDILFLEEVFDLGRLVLHSCPPATHFCFGLFLYAFGGEVLIVDDVRFHDSTYLPIPINKETSCNLRHMPSTASSSSGRMALTLHVPSRPVTQH